MINRILIYLSTALLLALLWLTTVTLPNKEKEISWINAKADSLLALPPKVEYLPGKEIRTTEYDTLYADTLYLDRIVLVDSSEQYKKYESLFSDGIIQGTIFAELRRGSLTGLNFRYRFTTPIYSTVRTDSLITTRYVPRLINRAEQRSSWSVYLSLNGGYDSNKNVLFAPGLSIVDRNNRLLSYKYDLQNQIHWLGLGLPIVNKKQ